MSRAGTGTGWPAPNGAGRPRAERAAAMPAMLAAADHEPCPLPAGTGPHTCATCGQPLEPVYRWRHSSGAQL